MRIVHATALLTLTVTTVLCVICSGCGKDSDRSSVTSFKEIHARDIKMKNPCLNGYAYCVKLKKCIRPFGLVKDGRIADMEKRFNETCGTDSMRVRE